MTMAMAMTMAMHLEVLGSPFSTSGLFTAIFCRETYTVKHDCIESLLIYGTFCGRNLQAIAKSRHDSIFTALPDHGCLTAQSGLEIQVTAKADDALVFRDRLRVCVKYGGESEAISLRATGRGSTLTLEPVSFKSFDEHQLKAKDVEEWKDPFGSGPICHLGSQFAGTPLVRRLCVRNVGRRPQQVIWCLTESGEEPEEIYEG
ncbi:unnamed protein product [Protopolystoma xenopodis]|uniref:Uncharacterized protein n=1 Tax=Protopolystoma xenopodis TaxID=117903 RepID=A0A448XE95_9PLAT|nr:unnamed protein product [Protopolystoma xenopodis]